jgi:hypothetical protein
MTINISMKKKNLILFIAIIFGLWMVACDSKPRIIESEPIENSGSVGDFENPIESQIQSDMSLIKQHKVKVKEVLNTERYTYLNVTEEGDKFWIAIPRKEVEIGGTYYYIGGLLKRNFQSKEFNRVFKILYLVSDVIPHPINSSGPITHEKHSGQGINSQKPIIVTPEEGAIKLSELFSDPARYQGMKVKVTGKCVKVNPKIMNRNWVHIQDGSGDGRDLTVTTTKKVSLGAIVSLEGIITLDKDFGAGYRYDIIMEEAILK